MSDIREFPMEFEGGPQMLGPCALRPRPDLPLDRQTEPVARTEGRRKLVWTFALFASLIHLHQS